MAFRLLPRKNYRLHDGSLGTEYEALLEVLKSLESQKLHLEDRIEETRRKLDLAEGHP